MNDFLDSLGKMFNEAASKAIKASGDAVELTKTSLNIKFDEIKRESFFKEIGKAVYEEYKADPGSVCGGVLDFCKCIDEIEKDIDEQVVRAAHIKNKKFCVNCGIMLEKYVNYCHECGAKQPVIVEEEAKEPCCCCCTCDPCECDPCECCDCDPCGCGENADETCCEPEPCGCEEKAEEACCGEKEEKAEESCCSGEAGTGCCPEPEPSPA